MIRMTIKQIEDLTGEGSCIGAFAMVFLNKITSVHDRLELMCEIDKPPVPAQPRLKWKVVAAWHQYTPENSDFTFTTHNETCWVTEAEVIQVFGEKTVEISKKFDATIIASIGININRLD